MTNWELYIQQTTAAPKSVFSWSQDPFLPGQSHILLDLRWSAHVSHYLSPILFKGFSFHPGGFIFNLHHNARAEQDILPTSTGSRAAWNGGPILGASSLSPCLFSFHIYWATPQESCTGDTRTKGQIRSLTGRGNRTQSILTQTK